MAERFDVVVCGGGPAGAVCASRLAQKGVATLVLEKARFPRFRIGESLLPQSLPVLDEIGVLGDVDAAFLRKYGARFHDDIGGRSDRFVFDGAWNPRPDHAFEVTRDTFDRILLDRARRSGACVREEHEVTRILEGGVEATDPDGQSRRIDASFVVDATGRAAIGARARGATDKIASLDQTAIYAHFAGVPRRSGREEGDIEIVLFDGGGGRINWFWLIPLPNGNASVGAVLSRGWLRARRGSTSDLLSAAVAASPTAARLLANATMIWPKPEAAADFSYRVRDLVVGRTVLVGDAAGFVDPLFSTGAHLAIVGGLRAADAIAGSLAEPSREGELLASFGRALAGATETFFAAVTAFYAGPLVETLFAPDKHDTLRRSVTSLLAGDVFGDAIWLRDAKRRIAAMCAGAQAGGSDQASF